MSLNVEQIAAVEECSNLLVVALPGSGKTHLLTEKTKFILGQNPANKILAVTFTNEAAEELSHRISKIVGPQTFAQSCAVSTFHKLCGNQLKRAGITYRLISDAEQFQYVTRAAAICGYDLNQKQVREVVMKIGAAKSTHTPPEFGEWFAKIYAAYTSLINESKSYDFGDLILGAVMGMKDGTIPPYACSHMLVDEAQDLDPIQCEYVLMHHRANCTVTMVGDDDQSIYRFRNSMGFRGMQRFREETGARIVTLSVNYRSHSEILHAAAKCISNNKERLPKIFNANKGPGGRISVLITPDISTEAEIVSSLIEKSISSRGYSDDNRLKVEKEEWAVLVRNNAHLLEIQAALRARGIPYFKLSDRPIWEHPFASPFLGLLAHIAKRSHGIPANVFSWIGVPEQFIPKSVQSTQDVVSSSPEIVNKFYSEYEQNLRNWIGMARNRDAPVSSVLLSVAVWLQHWRGLLTTSDSKKKRDAISSVIDELCDLLASLKGSLSMRLASLRRLSGGKPSFDAVYLLSMHASKGLQFQNVIVASANHDTMPSKESVDDADVEEERRLFYVAVTRPKKNLIISWHGGGPSRFIQELGVSPFPGEGRAVYFVKKDCPEDEKTAITDQMLLVALQSDIFAVAQADNVVAY